MGFWDNLVDLFTPDPDPPREPTPTRPTNTYGLGSQLG